MSENQSSRRKFIQALGLSAGTTLLNTDAIARFMDPQTILKLNPEQQEFMNRYGKWMDEFVEVIRVQKAEPGNRENQLKMVDLTERAEAFKPELTELMRDETFSVIYMASIQRMSQEI